MPDLLKDDLNVIFCGTAVGNQSAKNGDYYSNPRNKFWTILYKVGLTQLKLDPIDYKELLTYGIGLTDLVKDWNGNDKDIKKEQYDVEKLSRTISDYQPKFLCFNGKGAAKEYLNRRITYYGLQPETYYSTSIYVAPSTSGAANRYWDDAYWFELANLIQN
ncbi:mismatch-specific DNA-glycosylase [Virgibacillus siamensis]|uniref:mismatch-specific DNA-glycosylase n=1 Tax=Virgibacillus siamensis TaxID=480071 RepID=UPI0031D68623